MSVGEILGCFPWAALGMAEIIAGKVLKPNLPQMRVNNQIIQPGGMLLQNGLLII